MGFIRMTREEKVNEFRRAAGKGTLETAPQDADMISVCIAEEFEEFVDAALDYEEAIEDGDIERGLEARAQLCKEWADLQYVVSQAALYYEIPADAAFNRVHNSNMTKVVDNILRINREDASWYDPRQPIGKVLKPDTYEAPDMSGL